MLSVLKKNLPLKLFSLFLALFLWIVINRGTGGKDMEISLGIPVELHNLSPEMEVVAGPVERVDIRISGPRRIVSRISQMGITIQLDLSGAVEGETTFELYPGDVKVPERTTVTRISPSSVSLKLEKTVRKSLSVVPVVKGKPAEGFVAGAPLADPLNVEVRGPRSQVKPLRSIKTAPVLIDQAVETVTANVSLVMPDPLLRVVGKPKVTVTVPIRPIEDKIQDKKPKANRK